ncbi:TRAP transporter substrate-binding protein DctP [Microbacterium sp. No. 7]|uniref:TRAP transporter substrate-binding protein DctP n=1 Tax=Microbacterium sp. No. 7 TaxID=1714373 RepID=UPI0006ED149B|nr:TRAP transporter substrate-binding protein DctP [Microbacterium sp. No. 7]ALJ19274.1 hypothetical protein AOA12_04890 [Microbacterium sp. No. 7]
MPRIHRSKKMAMAAATIAGAALLLAGCSGDGDTGSTGGDGGSTGGDAKETITLTYTSILPESGPANQAFKVWMDEVTALTDGQVQFDAFYDAALCAAADALECIEDGRADLAFDTPAYSPELVSPNIASIGFQTYDHAAVGAAINELVATDDTIANEYAERNQKILFFGAQSPAVIGFVEGTDLTSVNDMDGKQVRAASQIGTALSLLGVSPVSMAPGEVYESIERGVIQGVVQSIDVYVDLSLAEVAPMIYSLDDAGAYAVVNFGMNLDKYESLPDDVKEAIDAASAKMIDEGVYAQYQNDSIGHACTSLKEQGATIQGLGLDADGKAWATAATERLVADWKTQAEGKIADPDAFADTYFGLVQKNVTGDAKTIAQICDES